MHRNMFYVNLILTKFLFFQAFTLYADTQVLNNRSTPIVISKGEVHELPFLSTQRFSVSQKKCLSAKVIKNQKKIILKGLCLGFAEVVIWKKSESTIYPVYILSKQEQLKLTKTLQTLNSYGLAANFNGDFIEIKNEIKNIEQYQLIQKLNGKNKLLIQSRINKKLRNKIIGEIYEIFHEEDLSDYYCKIKNIKFHCSYSESQELNKTSKKYLQDYYGVSLFKRKDSESSKNFRIKLIIYQLERSDGEEISFGLDQINTRGVDLFASGLPALVNNNQILFKDNQIQVSTLARPETIINLGKKATIQLGSEIPFKTQVEGVMTTQWRFAGIKLNLKLDKISKNYQIDYSTELYKPTIQGDQVFLNGSKNSSMAMVKLTDQLNLFQISLTTENETLGGIPYLSEIPVLGKLFSSSLNSDQFKLIIGTIKIERV